MSDEQVEESVNRVSTPNEADQASSASEFYGPSGTFYFLSKLRSQVNTRHESNIHRQGNHQTVAGDSVAHLLHSSDYDGATDLNALHRSQAMETQSTPTGSARSGILPASRGAHTGLTSSPLEFELQIQRECIRLYFENLHCVHPILDHKLFLENCEKEVWLSKEPTVETQGFPQREARRGFLSLFNIVLAIGAITAGETSMLNWERTLDFLECNSGANASLDNSPLYTPTRIARMYFEKAKELIGDVFESSSFETAQTLFLMVRMLLRVSV